MIVLKVKHQRIEQVAFAARRLLAVGEVGTYLWDLEEPAKPREYASTFGYGAALDRTGRWLIAGRHVSIQDATSEDSFSIALGSLECRVATSPAESIFLVESMSDGHLSCWQLGESGKATRLWSLYPQPGSIRIGPAFSPDGSWFVRYGANTPQSGSPQLLLHDPTRGKLVRIQNVPELADTTPAVSPSGRLIAYGSAWCLVIAQLDVNLTRIVENDSRKHFTGIAFHPSGRYLAATSNDRTVKLYDTTTWSLARTFTWDIGKMRSITFSPDGALAAAGSDSGKVVVWDVDL